ncbi:MAG: hypothetical protein M3Q88_07615 [Pseudomonadota bacterium]|nr:hypothetical protein [Pseudomonadota bacterium]
MADQNQLPEGTDSIVTGASTTNEDSLIMSNSNSGGQRGRGASDSTGDFAGNTTSGVAGVSGAAGSGADAATEVTSTTSTSRTSGGTRQRAVESLRSGSEKLSGQAADKARGLVGQGLERGSEALANVSKLIGDTASGLDERLGEQYGDYARKAASTIEETANRLASKDADELIEDTRGFVRKSPGVALAGAAVLGFALVRLVKSGLDQSDRTGPKNS